MSMRAKSCPCCGDRLLRHVRHDEVYWFCKTCYQEIPLLTVNDLPKVEDRTVGVVATTGVRD
jgi:ribosomal protein L37AE/L43A